LAWLLFTDREIIARFFVFALLPPLSHRRVNPVKATGQPSSQAKQKQFASDY
jgi:hypothetical protein